MGVPRLLELKCRFDEAQVLILKILFVKTGRIYENNAANAPFCAP